MPRPKLHRAACDCFECEPDIARPAFETESTAAARQDPPPKCLVIHADCVGPPERERTAHASTSGTNETPGLDRLAQRGCCGLVSYRDSAEGGSLERLAQILHQDQHEGSLTSDKLQVRYNHLQARFMSNSPAACSVAEEAGMRLLPLCTPDASQASNSSCPAGWPLPQDIAQRAMQVLGCQTPLAQSVGPQHTIVTSQEEATSEEDVTDLLMLHIAQPAEAVFPDTNHTGCPMAGVNSRGVHDADQGLRLPPVTQQDADTHHSSSSTGSSTSAALYSWLNDLVALLWRSAAFHQSVLLVLLLSNPCNNALQLQADDSSKAVFEGHDFPKVARPLQSHCISKMKAVPQCRSHSSLMVQHLPGVVKQDHVQSLSISDIVERGGGCCILAEHILPELAYKLGRAAKYGA